VVDLVNRPAAIARQARQAQDLEEPIDRRARPARVHLSRHRLQVVRVDEALVQAEREEQRPQLLRHALLDEPQRGEEPALRPAAGGLGRGEVGSQRVEDRLRGAPL
jgi:hypothetical protein